MNIKKFTTTLKAIVFLAITSVVISSCTKDLGLADDYTNDDVQQNGTAKMRFIHVAPNLQGVSVRFNDGSVVGDSLRYKNVSGYADVAIGSSDNGFVIDASPRVDSTSTDSLGVVTEYFSPNKEGNIANLQQTNFILRKDVKYTCFVYDASDYVSDAVSRSVSHTVLSEEAPASTVTDTAWVRFYNLSSTVGPVDLKITNNSNGQITTIANAAFLGFPANTVITPGNYNFEVTQFGTITSRNNVDIQNAKGYTFYLRGVATLSGDKQLELDMITNGE